jgi:aryl-alcohol dehydrogenase-like predicted oxidoreductase
MRRLGRTGIKISELAFGAGPVPAVMTGDDATRQTALVERALAAGINWFDTAAGYGGGRSERNLGRVLRSLGAEDRVHVASKVRLAAGDLSDIASAVETSCEESLGRLGLSHLTLLQLHNSVTQSRGDEPTSITPHDVLGPGGVLEGFQRLQSRGLVRHLGITGIGQAEPLRTVIRSGGFDTVQVPYNLVNWTAGRRPPRGFVGADYGNIMCDCSRLNVGVFAIRVLAGGALVGQQPSRHTLQTKFFPLDLYERDRLRAVALSRALEQLDERIDLKEASIRFVLSHPAVSTAIVGFSEPLQIEEVVSLAQQGVLPPQLIELIDSEVSRIAGLESEP